MKRYLLATAIALPLLSGCASWFNGEDANQPTPLAAIKQQQAIRVKWQVSVPAVKDGIFTPFYDAGTLWLANEDGRVQAVDALSGNTVARLELKHELSAGPAAADGVLYVGTKTGELLALDAKSGKELWKQNLTSTLAEPPQLAGKMLLVRAGDGRLSAFERASGRQLWTQWQPMPALTVRATSPQIKAEGDDVLIAGETGGKVSVYAVDQGRQLWQAAVANPRGASELERVTDVVSQPVFDGRRVCAVAFQGRTACFEARGGQLAWAREVGSSRGLSLDDSAVYVTADDGAIWAFDIESGRNLWKQNGFRYRNVTAPVKLGNQLLVLDGEGYAHLLSPVDGRMVGRSRVDVSGTMSRPLVLGDIAYVYGKNGTLAALTL
ncbi:outer membrane protein assembly factor BamB [Vogesella sp. LIG4]|uniref:outer membrane protein assembly factor BamB n=1 Tax=Vogesella sp. LIG4 TaxID=1192162 RepID=UPI0008200398|nr:outer membrane protein assembly factor BamB [Vogesella sp. LIG4]SCK20205.1 Beta-barrel assembly machine subunit BamB [Vogesella sp. LIG4]